MRKIVNPEGTGKPIGAFSRGILADPGMLLFVSGHTAVDQDGALVGRGDVALQTRKTFENIRTVVEAAGGGVRDIVSVSQFLVEPEHYPAMNEARREFFGDFPPASTTVIVKGLPRAGALVEINAIAVISKAK